MDNFQILFTILGGLGVFYFGKRLLSDALQATNGHMIRTAVSSLSENKGKSLAVGFFVTAAIQSSSVSSVTIISSVNAGLTQMTPALAFLLGANLGSTFFGWILALPLVNIGLLLIAAGIFPTLFAQKDRWRHTGKVLVGVGMLFFGLLIMREAFSSLKSVASFTKFISFFMDSHFLGTTCGLLLGSALAFLLQSSGVTFGLLLAATLAGVVPTMVAMTIVLGLNLGTTLTGLLAAHPGNRSSKRVSQLHFLLNLIVAGSLLIALKPFGQLVQWILPMESGVGVQLAVAHTLFNTILVLLGLAAFGPLIRLVEKITPNAPFKEKNKLILLGNNQDVIPSTALAQAHEEIRKMKELTDKMFRRTKSYIESPRSEARVLAKIKEYERVTDNIQREIAEFISYVLQKSLSHQQSLEAQSLIRIADELESVADYLDKLATYKTRFDEGTKLEGEAQTELFELMEAIEEFYYHTTKPLLSPAALDVEGDTKRSEFLRIKAEKIRKNHLARVGSGQYPAITTLTFSDMVVALRKIRSHCHNITQALERAEEN